jgi:hypothetical protein
MPDRQALLGNEIAAELRRAQAKFGPMASPHEGWAVIREELDELWDHVKANTGRTLDARTEAIQIAAMAARYAYDLAEQQRGSQPHEETR